jgi:hypothetical protein
MAKTPRASPEQILAAWQGLPAGERELMRRAHEAVERFNRLVWFREGRRIIEKMMPAPPPQRREIEPPSERMTGKVWLEGDKAAGIVGGFERFPRKASQSVKAWSRRLSAEAAKDGVPIKDTTIERHIRARRR